MGIKSNAAKQIILSSLDSALLDPVIYTPFNEDGLSDPCYMIRILNHTKGNFKICFWWGGDPQLKLDHDFLPIGDSLCLYALPSRGDKAAFGRGTKIYVAGTPSIGNIILIGYYQPREN